jgi:hypothetical protein
MARYVSNIIKERFLPPNADSEWRRLSDNYLEYLPLKEEEQNYLYELISGNNVEDFMNIYAEY